MIKLFFAFSVLMTSSVAMAYPACPGNLHHCTCCEYPEVHCKVEKVSDSVQVSDDHDHEEDSHGVFIENLKSGEFSKEFLEKK